MILLHSIVNCNSSHAKFEELISRKIRRFLLTKRELRRLGIRLKADNPLLLWEGDLAELYGVETKRINESVKNNSDKFPEGYLFELTASEWSGMKSKFSTSYRGGKVNRPNAFTDVDLYMMLIILKSPQAVQTNLSFLTHSPRSVDYP